MKLATYGGHPVRPTPIKICPGCGARGEYPGRGKCPVCTTPDLLKVLKP